MPLLWILGSHYQLFRSTAASLLRHATGAVASVVSYPRKKQIKHADFLSDFIFPFHLSKLRGVLKGAVDDNKLL